MANIKKQGEHSSRTGLKKKHHSYGCHQMWLDYKRKCKKKYRETRDKKWKKPITEKQYKILITETYKNVEDRLLNNRAVKLGNLGTLRLREYDQTKQLKNLRINRSSSISLFLPFQKKSFFKFNWDKSGSDLKNIKYYVFKPLMGDKDRGAERLKNKRRR